MQLHKKVTNVELIVDKVTNVGYYELALDGADKYINDKLQNKFSFVCNFCVKLFNQTYFITHLCTCQLFIKNEGV